MAIAIAVRYGAPNLNNPAQVNYCRIEGGRAAKLEKLESIDGLRSLQFEECPTDWHSPFRPQSAAAFFDWPLFTDLMPWQHSGSQIKRSWPIAATQQVLEVRWEAFLRASDRASAFKESRDRKIKSIVSDLETGEKLQMLADLPLDAAVAAIRPYGFRSFDRQWLIADSRLADYFRPPLWHSYSGSQIYFSSLLSSTLGVGPALSISAEVPDLHYFSGRGAKDIVPLYRDAQTQHPNMHPALTAALSSALGEIVGVEDVAAYIYCVLAHPAYTESFHAELENREVRVPITLDRKLFAAAVTIGRRLIYLHSYGERFAQGQSWPQGSARNAKAISTEHLPEKFSYDAATQTLYVGDGQFKPVVPGIWEFEISGLKVVQSWLGYRMKNRKGKKSSPLDDIAPTSWSPEFTSELLRLIHLLEETMEIYPKQNALLDQILREPLLKARDLGTPPEEYRKAPESHVSQGRLEI